MSQKVNILRKERKIGKNQSLENWTNKAMDNVLLLVKKNRRYQIIIEDNPTFQDVTLEPNGISIIPIGGSPTDLFQIDLKNPQLNNKFSLKEINANNGKITVPVGLKGHFRSIKT